MLFFRQIFGPQFWCFGTILERFWVQNGAKNRTKLVICQKKSRGADLSGFSGKGAEKCVFDRIPRTGSMHPGGLVQKSKKPGAAGVRVWNARFFNCIGRDFRRKRLEDWWKKSEVKLRIFSEKIRKITQIIKKTVEKRRWKKKTFENLFF